ncbi:MAG: class I tRNA ligase family protein, partial [Myxococcales bacterium]
KCGNTKFKKENDILDVWFDSGVSYAAVADKRARLRVPVDLYLEGSDQHRGWFHSALLCSVGTRDAAPYKAVLTHGFVVDGEGRKMSKSLGNVIAPEKIVKDLGAEILRLWVSAADYRDDIRLSPKILEGLAEGYRKIRNTLRYALGNLHDFDPAKDTVPDAELQPIDRWARARLAQLTQKVRRAYEEYEFHVVYHSVLDFCAVDLSAVYFDVLKDRLYTGARSSRRAAQTVVHQILLDLLRLLAPITSFTCEEAWQTLPHKPAESVFFGGLPEAKLTAADEAVLAEFDRLLEVRSEVQKALETARREKLIGAPLEAKVTLTAPAELHGFLAERLSQLPPLFIVSKVELQQGGDAVAVKVERAPGEKCPRCWNYSEAIGADQPVCPKCREALAER